jgi:hypothetical protein
MGELVERGVAAMLGRGEAGALDGDAVGSGVAELEGGPDAPIRSVGEELGPSAVTPLEPDGRWAAGRSRPPLASTNATARANDAARTTRAPAMAGVTVRLERAGGLTEPG